jgi:hypothetical protein
LGDIGSDSNYTNPAYSDLANPSPSPAGASSLYYVSLKHDVKGTSTLPGSPYLHAGSTLEERRRRVLWNRLRIFGSMPTSSAASCSTNSNAVQSFYIDPDPDPLIPASNTPQSASLAGTFLWLPRGRLVYGEPGDPANATYPSELLSVWWICSLDIRGLSPNRMTFLNPLFGNHDAVSALLPGGFTSAGGAFIPDKRFPVYPVLMRIRSAY